MIGLNWFMGLKMKDATNELIDMAEKKSEEIDYAIILVKTEEGKVYQISTSNKNAPENEDLLMTFMAFTSFIHNEMGIHTNELIGIIRESGLLEPTEVK